MFTVTRQCQFPEKQIQSRRATNTGLNVYEIVTEQVIKQLESGSVPWRKPWANRTPVNLLSQREYRGINTFLLGSQGYSSRYWLTYAQAAKLGGHVKAGEKSSIVVFWNIGKEKLNPKTGKISKPFLLKYYRVFNLSQTDGIAHKLGIAETAAERVADIPACESLVAAMPQRPGIQRGNAASYSPSFDVVTMPDIRNFDSSEFYFSTLFHELTHSTGHVSRIGRDGITETANFGSEIYSREELIAEMGSAMLCGVTGISPCVIENSAAYLRSWINVLKGDSKLLVTAASAAQKAADFIRGIKPGEVVAEDSSAAEVV